jgi:putative oxidoreductase
MLESHAESSPRSMPLADASAAHDGLPGNTGDLLILIGRILVGQLYVVSGWGKITAISAFSANMAKAGVPMPEVLGFVGPCVEFFGGLALVFGFMTRWSAALLILFTIVASFIGHRYWEFADAAVRRGQQINFYKNVTIIGGFLFLMVTGGGRFSIDGLLRRRSS